MNRSQLIDRKNQVGQQLVLARREIDRLNMGQGDPLFRRRRKQMRNLEDKIERLMSEEADLRIKIDKTASEEAPTV